MLLDRINEGGPFFMWPIVFIFIILVALFVRQLVTKANKDHTITLLSNISLFILAWGILGSVIGLIQAFDAKKVESGFSYNSGDNEKWETVESLRTLIKEHVDATFEA